MTDEGTQIEEFPGITFRDGPTGRRAGIVNGPDIWEIVRDLKVADRHGSQSPIESVATVTGVDHAKIELAASYYAAYPDDVDKRIRTNEEAAERLHRAYGAGQ
jgi:hypothetical protein